MNRGLSGLPARLAVSACGAATIFASGSSARESAPFHCVLTVRWGPDAGSDAFRDDLSRSLAGALATGCFTGVATAAPGSAGQNADLDYDVVLSDVADEIRFDDSIAGSLQPGDPSKELRHVSRFEVTVDATLTTRVTGAAVNKKHLVARVSHRPVYVGEDAQATARAEAIELIVHDLTRALGCGGAKLTQKIREAIGDARQATPGPR